MALRYGRKGDSNTETIWIEDSALLNVPAQAREAWRADGDACHLRQYAINGTPDIFTFRSLSMDEREYVRGFFRTGEGDSQSAIDRAVIMAFRIAVDFPSAPMTIPDANGVQQERIVRESKIRMLSEHFTRYMEDQYPGITYFYGLQVIQRSFMSELEKKALSRPPTAKPSSVEASTTADTAGSAKTDEAVA